MPPHLLLVADPRSVRRWCRKHAGSASGQSVSVSADQQASVWQTRAAETTSAVRPTKVTQALDPGHLTTEVWMPMSETPPDPTPTPSRDADAAEAAHRRWINRLTGLPRARRSNDPGAFPEPHEDDAEAFDDSFPQQSPSQAWHITVPLGEDRCDVPHPTVADQSCVLRVGHGGPHRCNT